jgi:flagellar biosynthesis protein FlhF
MKVKRYVAPTSREALARVKKDLGPDAVILANRPAQGGVEILALANRDVGEFAAPRPAPAAPRPAPRAATAPAARAAHATPAAQASAAAAERPLKDFARRVEPAPAQAVAPAASAESAKLYSELRSMRNLVEEQLARFAWTDGARRHPLRAQVLRELIAAGYSAPLGRRLSGALPEDHDAAQARLWLRRVLQRNLACDGETDNLVERGGVYALVGPTGVGKTTTIAKIAARFVVRFGAQQVALVSTDSYRVGAQDQLRIYARILGVPMQAVQDAASLQDALASLRDKRLVLIDTVGMGQRDARLGEQHELLSDRRVRRVLLLNAASQLETLEDVVRAYRGAAQPAGPALAIVTKLDEARRAGGAIDVAMRHRLRLAFVTDGQRVPEDIRLPDAAALIESTLEGAAASPFALEESELHDLPAAGGLRRAA